MVKIDKLVHTVAKLPVNSGASHFIPVAFTVLQIVLSPAIPSALTPLCGEFVMGFFSDGIDSMYEDQIGSHEAIKRSRFTLEKIRTITPYQMPPHFTPQTPFYHFAAYPSLILKGYRTPFSTSFH